MIDRIWARAARKFLETAVKEGWIDRFLNALRRKHRVIVLGATGVGKTNLIHSLTEDAPKAIHYMNRTEARENHVIKISDQPFVFIDLPGQRLHVSRRKQAIQQAMAQGIACVLDVVSYGYHEYRIGKAKAVTRTGEPREEFLAKRRETEIRALAEWTPLLGSRHIGRRLITIVTKADLWWGQQSEVFRHYESGPYKSALGEAMELNPILLEYCSVIHKFFGIGAVCGQFDESEKARIKSRLLYTLLAVVSEE